MRRTDYAELRGSNAHGRNAKKAAALLVNFFGHFLPLTCDNWRS
jgi:hypothetical protein